MVDYRIESVQSDIDDLADVLEGKYRDTLSGGDWSLVSDPTHGSCYRATVTHSFGNSANNVTLFNASTGDFLSPLGIRDVDINSFYVFMPINTINVVAVVN